MSEEFSHSILIKVVAQICQMVGFEKIMSIPLVVLADVLERFILKIGKISLRYAEHCGGSVISLRDLSCAFHDCGILPDELTEFLELVSPLPKCINVPTFPVARKSQNTPRDSYDVCDLIKVENVQRDSEENFSGSRETLKIKISLSKIREACEAKKRRNKKNKLKRKKKMRQKNFE